MASLQNETANQIETYQNAAKQKLDSFQSETETQIETFQTNTNTKLENLSKIITDSVHKAVSESEVKHLNILENVDSELNAYKKDIEYKLSQIQISDSDIDNLEKSLKAAMAEVQNRALSTFDNFTSSQKQKNEDFAKEIKENSAALELKIKEINDSLDSLKETATGNMSQKLQEFESQFNQTLSTKNNEFDSDLAEWKHNLDTKLTTLTNSFEDSRKEVEAKYSDQLKSNIENLQTKTSDQFTKVSASIESTKIEMQDAIQDIQDVINKFKNDANSSISVISKNNENELKRELEHNMQMVQQNLTKVQEQMMEDLKAFQESVQTKQETGTSTIDAALSEFKTWKAQIQSQFESSELVFSGQIDQFKVATQDKIDEVGQKLFQNMNAYETSIQQQHNDLNDQIADLQNKTQNSISDYENSSKQILAQLNKMYDDMVKSTQEKIQVQNQDTEAKIESFKKEIQDATAANQSEQSKLFLRMQDDANGIQSQIMEIQKELQDVRTNIQVYDKADKMKRQLEDNIQELNESFSKLQNYSDSANQMNDEYKSILKINEEITNKLSEVESQKSRVVTLEQKFQSMIALSNTIDDRILALNNSQDDIQSMEVTVRNYEERLKEVADHYDRLEKKDEVVARIRTDVDSQFEKLKDLEQRLNNCNRQAISLPQEIKEVQGNVDKILQNGPKITNAIGRLETLDNLLADTEKRIDALNSVQTGIKKTELDLQGLSRDVDNKFRTLQQITQKELQSKPTAKGQSLNPQTNEAVKQLKREGWTIPEIANNLHLTENEVDLILQLS